MSSVHSVVLAGGGTAGHVNPLLAVAHELVRRHPSITLSVLGTEEGIETELVPAAGYQLRFLPRVPLPRRPSGDWFSLPQRLQSAVSAAADVMTETAADVVVGFGGYVSTPAYLAARRLGIPVVIHEQNARPGLANRLGARWAASTAVTFEKTGLPNAVVTGLPLRQEIADLVAQRSGETHGSDARLDAMRKLEIDPDLPTLVVTGGSLGAQRINDAIVACAAALTEHSQVLHLTGRGKSDCAEAAVAALPEAMRGRYHVREYLPEMQWAYSVADLVVCRAGAGTVCELAALGLPAVYVPLPIGNGEQARNAQGIIAAGGGVLVEDRDFDAESVRSAVLPLLLDASRRQTMAASARAVGREDATAAVVDLIEKAAGTHHHA